MRKKIEEVDHECPCPYQSGWAGDAWEGFDLRRYRMSRAGDLYVKRGRWEKVLDPLARLRNNLSAPEAAHLRAL